MAHSEKRRGKRVKQSTVKTHRKNLFDLPTLFEKSYTIKKSEGLSESTLYRYRHAHKLFVQFLETNGHSQDFRELTVDNCRGFSTWLLNDRPRNEGHKYKPESSKTDGISPRSVNDIIKSLRTSFSVLVDDNVIDSNPFDSVKSVKQPQKLINTLTPDELKSLMMSLDKRSYPQFRDYVLITVLIETMARISEVLTLKLSDVDLSSKEIIFKSEITKTRVGRIVPIQQRTARLLKELIVEVEEFESEYVFLSNYGDPLTPNNFRKRLASYAKQVGIKKRVHPHLIRHSAATIYLESGGNLRYLQSLLGHVDQRMTSRYTHLSRASIAENREQFSALNEVMGKLNKPRKLKR
ncbi:tyrosine-type recombinase/integrase [Bacillus sp. SCS-153A]|uniref:tyrosine-type recombinase/integrase n=1 Tax=Rossellomorea sedimentorum TaxID=3115294 RepID=UPI003905EAFC